MRRLCRAIAAMTLCVGALGAAGASFEVSPASAADWKLQLKIKGEQPRPFLPMLGISCPTASLCVAVGELNTIASSTNPTGGASAWRVVKPTGAADTDCQAGWIPPCRDPMDRRIRGVSCPSAQLCVAVTGEGYVYSTTKPTGSADDWDVADVDGDGRDTHLLGVSCPSVSLCVAVSGERHTAGKVLTATNPTGGAAAWTEVQLDPTLDLRAISCGTTTLCVATAQDGRILVSTNPAGGASAWTVLGTPGGAGAVQGIGCATTVICVAGNAGGNVLVSTNPLAASSWQKASLPVSVQMTDAVCLPSRQCVAIDNNGDVFASNDPRRGAGSWMLTRLIPYIHPPGEYEEPINGLFGVDCVSATFCALTAIDGQIFTSTNPFAETAEPVKTTHRQRVRRKRPKTTIARLKYPNLAAVRRGRGRVMARFFAHGAVRRFECKLNRGRFRACRSPKYFKVKREGTYAIRVRAVGTTGLRGPTALKRFWVGKRCVRKMCMSGAGPLPVKPRKR